VTGTQDAPLFCLLDVCQVLDIGNAPPDAKAPGDEPGPHCFLIRKASLLHDLGRGRLSEPPVIM
jgi:hypothetical protein